MSVPALVGHRAPYVSPCHTGLPAPQYSTPALLSASHSLVQDNYTFFKVSAQMTAYQAGLPWLAYVKSNLPGTAILSQLILSHLPPSDTFYIYLFICIASLNNL